MAAKPTPSLRTLAAQLELPAWVLVLILVALLVGEAAGKHS